MFISKYLVVIVFFFCTGLLFSTIEFEAGASEQKKKAIENMFEVNLAVKKGERVLVFTDDHKPEITEEAIKKERDVVFYFAIFILAF
ncbi:MAG: hypothetical protein KGZ49_00800 [Syntrophaceae bacterium]|nr:hypothetical protein [Syntrophaceae bacterium]